MWEKNKYLPGRIAHIEKRLEQLECPHLRTKLESMGHGVREEVCKSCGKVIRFFSSEKEYYETKVLKYENEVNKYQKLLAELESNAKQE